MKQFSTFISEISRSVNNALNEVSDESNIKIRWLSDGEASFRIEDMPYTVSFGDGGEGKFTISFQGRDQQGRMTYGKTKGGNGAAVISTVLTATREFIEMFDREHGFKPYSFDFTAAIERVSRGSFESDDEYKKELKRSKSRPKLYKRAAERMGSKHGYSVDFSTSGSSTSGGTVSFELTLIGADEDDYSSIGVGISIEDVDSADMSQIEDWINDGKEDEIVRYADWSTLVNIADSGLMHDILIYNDDVDVRNAVLRNDPEMADNLATSDDDDHRAQAAEYGYNIYQLTIDRSDSVREAALQYAMENFDPDEFMNLADYVKSRNSEYIDEILDYFVDYGGYELNVYAAEAGYRIDELLSYDDDDTREAAVLATFERFGEEDSINYIEKHSGDYAEENFTYILDRVTISDESMKIIKDLAYEHGIDVSNYFDDE
jgi:hypothetical protein